MNRTNGELVRDRIINRVLTAHRISKADLLGKSRDADLVMARKAIAHSLKAERFSVRHIGRILHRDRSTIEHYLGMRVDSSMLLPNSLNCFPEDVRNIVASVARSERTAPAALITEWIIDRARFELAQKRSAA